MGVDQELAAQAARRYIEQLAVVCRLPRVSQALTGAAQRLSETLTAAIAYGPAMETDMVTFSAGMVDALMASGEWRYLLNPWTLGFGTDRPRVLALGTEGAATPSSALGVWDFAGSAVVLTDSSWPILARLAAGLDSTWTHAMAPRGEVPAYHRNPYEVLRRMGVRAIDEPRHTWALLARAVGPAPVDERGDPNSLWGDAYLIERSALPAKLAIGGSAPSPSRVAFLCDVVGVLRKTARVLVIYGHNDPNSYTERPDGDLWAWANREVTKTFLGIDILTPPVRVATFDDDSSRRRSLGIWRGGERVAVWTWALSGRNVTDGYLRAVRAEVDAV